MSTTNSLYNNISPLAGRSSHSQTSDSSSYLEMSERSHRESLTPPSMSRNNFVDLEKYSRKYTRIEGWPCESNELISRFTRRVGHTDISSDPRGSHELRAVDIFLPEEVSRVVSENGQLVTKILECSCSVCIEMPPPNEDRCISVGQIVGDVPEAPRNGPTTPTTPSETISDASSSFMPSTMPMSVIFAILVYLRLPFLIHLGFWTDIHKYPDGWVLDQLLEMTRETGSCTYFHKLSLLRRAQRNESNSHRQWNTPQDVFEQEAMDFYNAFKQAKSQFHPLYITTDMGTLADNAVLPYEEYEPRGRGGQGSIYVVKIPQEMDRTLSKVNDHPHSKYCCKLIPKSRYGENSAMGPSEHELAGLKRMRTLKHRNLIRMITWYDFAETRAFLMPEYLMDLNEYMVGKTVADFDAPHQGPRRNSRRDPQSKDSPYRFPTNHWLWRGIVGVLDGLQKFHGSGDGEERAAHLDLKPKNILIGYDGNLVIIDCGLSRVVTPWESSMTQADGEDDKGTYELVDEGTASYKPPRTQLKWNIPLTTLSEKCDIWSMACIMMEVMLFLIYGKGSVEEFRKGRISKSRGAIHDTFWECSPGGDTFHLKQVVESHLDKVQQISELLDDYDLENQITLLRRMFNMSPDERPTVGECLTQLNSERPTFRRASIRFGLGGTVNSLRINTRLAEEQYELGYYGKSKMPPQLQPVSGLPLKLMLGMPGLEYDCRIKLFVDRPDKDVSRLSLTTTYYFQGQIICEVEKANMRDEHLWTEGPCDDGKIHWGFHGLQEGNSFRSDYKSFVQIQQPLILQQSLQPIQWAPKLCHTKFSYPDANYISSLALQTCEVQNSSLLGLFSSIEKTISGRVEVWRGLGIDRQQALKSKDFPKPGQHNPGMHRLVIFRDCGKPTKIQKDCIIVQLFEERVTLITPTTGNSEGRKLYLVPNKYGPVKHKEIYYYCIKMGTKYSFPLRPYAMANLEAGKNGNPNISTVKTAELITLEFKSSEAVEKLRELFRDDEYPYLKSYFREDERLGRV